MEIDFQTFDHIVVMEKVAEQCISTTWSLCNSFQVKCDFICYGRFYLWPSTYTQDKREIPSIVYEKNVIKC